LFDVRSETGSYDSGSEFTETGLDDTDGPSPRPQHLHHRQQQQQQQQQQAHGLPPGRDSYDDDNTDWDDSVRSVPVTLPTFTATSTQNSEDKTSAAIYYSTCLVYL